MGKFDGVLLASDYDDTLLSTGLEVSQANVDAINYFIGQGGRFTVATGRALRTFAPQVSRFPMNAPAVLTGGAQLYDFSAGRYIYDTVLPDRAGADLLELTQAIPQLAFEAYHGDEIYAYHPNEVTIRHRRRTGVPFDPREIDDMPTPWSKVILQADTPVLQRAQDYMLSRWAEYYEVIFSNTILLEVTRKGCDKGGMVLKLAQLLGVRREDLYCVGDNQNDIPMLAVSAIPFAPNSCAQTVKDWGATLVRSCDESCIAHIIELLDRRY